MITLHVEANITHSQALHALAALNYEIRAAGYVASSHHVDPVHAAAIRARCARLLTLVPVAAALVAGTDPQADLLAPASSTSSTSPKSHAADLLSAAEP